jgi:hypothetical protein
MLLDERHDDGTISVTGCVSKFYMIIYFGIRNNVIATVFERLITSGPESVNSQAPKHQLYISNLFGCERVRTAMSQTALSRKPVSIRGEDSAHISI